MCKVNPAATVNETMPRKPHGGHREYCVYIGTLEICNHANLLDKPSTLAAELHIRYVEMSARRKSEPSVKVNVLLEEGTLNPDPRQSARSQVSRQRILRSA